MVNIYFLSLLGHPNAFELIHCGNDKIWLAPKQKAEQERMRKLFSGIGMIDNVDEAPILSNLHEYASRPMPIPPGKFQQSFHDGKSVSEVIEYVKKLPEEIVPQSVEPTTKPKEPKNIVISSPAQFRKGFK